MVLRSPIILTKSSVITVYLGDVCSKLLNVCSVYYLVKLSSGVCFLYRVQAGEHR